MSILVRKSGILSTIQDLGRTGYRRFGVNPGGAMDKCAVRLINILLGNDEDCSVIEMHYPAAEVVFERPTIFAIGGADFSPVLNGNRIANWTRYDASEGDVLAFPDKHAGNRAYLSVRGGFSVEPWIGSSSTNLLAGIGGLEGRRLRSGDCVRHSDTIEPISRGAAARLAGSCLPAYSSFPTIGITVGPEHDFLTRDSQNLLLTESFQITPNSNRMGFRLKGPTVDRIADKEMLSSGVTFGTIQLLPDGQLIVLMADHQTTGGYPRIATVVSTDLPVLAQLGPGDQLKFELISVEKAEEKALEFEKELGFLRTGLRAKFPGRL